MNNECCGGKISRFQTRCVGHYLGADVGNRGGANGVSFLTLHEHEAVMDGCGERRVEERECSLEGCRPLAKAVLQQRS